MQVCVEGLHTNRPKSASSKTIPITQPTLIYKDEPCVDTSDAEYTTRESSTQNKHYSTTPPEQETPRPLTTILGGRMS